jgi:nicotinamide-nucleotide amidase
MSVEKYVAGAIIDLLRASAQTVCVAESLTGGGLGAAITAVPGASDVFLGGVVAYQTEAKEKILSVPSEQIRENGVVSEEVAISMADGARALFGATWAIATTGVAGPGPTAGIPAGTVWVAIRGPQNQSFRLTLNGDRQEVRNATLTSAIAEFARILST